ncbi:MAG: ABC transporter ATP-binding protein [Spiribacter salinus]|uniref:ABC transporter ATP-binding protein n=1 Tax=Spiribacter salinus TaxID=1335746 RepID=A0A540VNQ1_9GAMM|nr:MAG: ABC transporter ATP-binding protein [Spiribacter salinus]
MLAGSLAEVVTIGAVVPFISLMAKPEMAAEFPLLQQLFGALGWKNLDSLVLPMSIAFVAIVAIATGIRLLLVYASNKLVFAIGHDIGVKLYRVVLQQPYAYHIAQNTSDVIANVNKVQILMNAFLRPAMEGVIAIILSVAILVALMVVDATTALSAGVLFAVLYLVIIRLFRARLKKNSRVIAETQSTRIRAVQEGLGGIRDVILDANHPHYTQEFARFDGQFRNAQAANAFLGQAPRHIVEAIGVGLIVALAYSLSLQPGGLVAALPTLAALALGAQRLLPLIQKIYQAWARYTGNFHVFEDVLNSLGLWTPVSTESTQDLTFQRQIELDLVYFQYSPDEPNVLSGVNLTIPKGSRVGIVGKTGSGKSTLMDILMGLLDPTSGKIEIDGQPIDQESRAAWQARISHVPQHIYLSDATIAENIALGIAPNAIDHERVRRAARQAQIAEFIENHRQGYETRVGERGIQLSGGQRQRIGIARALYKDADVLVFDEASSALDTKTESAVMDAVGQLDPDLTVFIIAHRVQTLRECDLVIRLEEGRVVSTGSYSEVVGSEALQAAAGIQN